MGNKKKKVAEYISTWTWFQLTNVFFFFFQKLSLMPNTRETCELMVNKFQLTINDENQFIRFGKAFTRVTKIILDRQRDVDYRNFPF